MPTGLLVWATTILRPVSPAALPALAGRLMFYRARIMTQALADASASTPRQTLCSTLTELIYRELRSMSPVRCALDAVSWLRQQVFDGKSHRTERSGCDGNLRRLRCR